MPLPKKIPGAQLVTNMFDNIARRVLQTKILRVLQDTENQAVAEIAQIDDHLSQAFELADQIHTHLKSAGQEDLAKEWLKVWTGHIVSYPLLSGPSED